ncbi:hypothetical protein SDC9_149923 [bioreactor metagenome]|uniref:Uncharacterized protein n=1 Tax=bioreactor metagenome TaxID=1076179 RepID=A0A645ELP2_9ZZZZ
MEFLNSLISSAGGAAVVLAALAFAPRRWIDGYFDRQMAMHQASLSRANLEHQIQFTRLDAKVTLAIEEAYEFLCDYSILSNAIVGQVYTDSEEALTARYKEWESVANDFNSFILKQSIYLPEEIAQRLGNTRVALQDEVIQRLQTWQEFKVRDEEGRASSSLLKGWYESAGMRTKCAELMNDLQKLVRAHLARFPVTADAT